MMVVRKIPLVELNMFLCLILMLNMFLCLIIFWDVCSSYNGKGLIPNPTAAKNVL